MPRTRWLEVINLKSMDTNFAGSHAQRFAVAECVAKL